MNETIGNQQVTQTQLAWLAGVWESEGHFSIRRTVLKKCRKPAPQYSPRVGLTNSDTLLLTEARRILDALDIGYYFREKDRGGFTGSSKQCWVIEIGTLSNALTLITAILPYLIGKRFQAQCLVEFCNSRIKHCDRSKGNKHRKYNQKDFKLVKSIMDANGNKRGTSETIAQDAQRAMI